MYVVINSYIPRMYRSPAPPVNVYTNGFPGWNFSSSFYLPFLLSFGIPGLSGGFFRALSMRSATGVVAFC